MERITSTTNPKVKNIIKLQKANERKEQGLFVIEGLKEINYAVGAGFEMHSLFFCPDLANEKLVNTIFTHFPSNAIFEINREVFAKVAYREGSDGVLALARQKNMALSNIKLSKNPLVVLLESVEKPGNLGAILRTADAAKVDAVIIADPKTDIFNPNVIRSSVGCVFTTQVAVCTNQEAINWLKSNTISAYAAALHQTSETYVKFDYNKPTAFVMGTEADGLTDFWLKNSDKKIIIPMLGENDSLNVSTATAVLVFEAMRQRNFTV